MDHYNISRENALLLIVDVQERLCPVMDAAWLDQVIKRIGLLALYARKEQLPVIMTEQYSKGLGKTVSQVMKQLEGIDYHYFDKTSFGCAGDSGFLQLVKEKYANKKIIVTGMETHVCVYLTALGLKEAGFDVFVPQDAVIARGKDYHQNGLQLMDRLGAVVTNTESLVFQVMKCAGGETFKAISNYVKELK